MEKSAPKRKLRTNCVRSQISDDADLLDKDFNKFAPMFDRMSVANYLDKHADKIPEPFIHILIEDAIHTEWGRAKSLRHCYCFPSAYGGNKVELLGDSDETFVIEVAMVGLSIVWHSLYRGRFFSMRLTQIQSRVVAFV